MGNDTNVGTSKGWDGGVKKAENEAESLQTREVGGAPRVAWRRG